MERLESQDSENHQANSEKLGKMFHRPEYKRLKNY